jgi:uncharacterized caspase-like protein
VGAARLFGHPRPRRNLRRHAPRALLQFGRDALGADMAVIYFAGRGIEIDGEKMQSDGMFAPG